MNVRTVTCNKHSDRIDFINEHKERIKSKTKPIESIDLFTHKTKLLAQESHEQTNIICSKQHIDIWTLKNCGDCQTKELNAY